MNERRVNIWSIVAALFAVSVVVLLFPSLVFHPSSTAPGVASDGGKNIYAYLYHVLYESGVWTYCMNYPFGEHILYTDGQPFLAMVLSAVGGFSAGGALVVMWWAILLSYVLGIVYTYRTVVAFGVPQLIALVASGLIFVCSPQLYRICGHFGLSYVCVIPMCFWWSLQYHRTGAAKHMVYIAVLGLVASLLHPYFAVLVFTWLGLYGASFFVTQRTPMMQRLRALLPVMVAAVAVPGILGLFIKVTDPVRDRPTAPYGMLEYRTVPKDVLVSANSPFWKFFSDHIHHINMEDGREGYAYAGVVVLVAVFFAAAGWVRRRGRRITGDSAKDLRPWLLIAVGGLVMSMVVPYVSEVDWLYNSLSLFKQFRTMGRFSWIFYYVVCVCGTVLVSNAFLWLRTKGRTLASAVLLACCFAAWAAEAGVHVVKIRDRFADGQKQYAELVGAGEYSWEQFLAMKAYTPSSFEALLILPFFEVGTDKLWLDRSIIHHSIKGAATAGLQLHLPLIDAMSARSSWSQIFKQVKIAAGPYVHKPVLDEIKGDKPFLLLNLDYSELDPDQQYLVAASDFIGHFHEWRVFACYPDRIRKADIKNRDSVLNLAASMREGDTAIGSASSWYINHFDSSGYAVSVFGAGALPMIKEGLAEVADIPVRAAENELYELSFWFLLESGTYRSPVCRIKMHDAGDHEIGSAEILVKESTDNRGMWFRGYSYFKVAPGSTRLKILIDNDNLSSYLAADELLLRPASALILSKRGKQIMVNNHAID